MAKKLVVILSVADWAGSQYQTHRAIKSVGEFECRHITMFRHPYEFSTDIFIPLFPKTSNEYQREVVRALKSDQYKVASEILSEADIIQLWNTYPGESALMSAGLPIPFNKVKIVTMTGSLYRDNHSMINSQLANLENCKVVVQDPVLKFEDEIDSIFIPHAVDIENLKPREDKENIVGAYRPNHKTGARHGERDIQQLYEFVKSFPDWHIDLDYSMPHAERIEKLTKCSIFVQDLSPYIGYWGRSTLEACALAIPCLQNYDNRLIGNSEGKLGEIPLIKVEWNTAEKELKKLIGDEVYRKEVGQKSRRWIEEYYSYSAVGKMYSDLYKQVL